MKQLTIAQDGAPESLDPHRFANIHSHEILWFVCESLFDVERDGTMVPRLLTGPPEKVTDLKYVFSLRPDVTFHDGRPLDAPGALANLQHAAGVPSVRGRILRDLIDFAQTTASGHTLTIALRYQKVELLFLALLTSPATLGSEQPRGTGPFVLKDRTAAKVTLSANPNYRGGPPKLDQIELRRVASAAAIAKELEQKTVDLVRIANPEVVALVEGKPDVRSRTADPFCIYYLGFNVDSTLFSDPTVRRAFNRAIDVKRIQQDARLAPARGVLPPGVEAHDDTLSLPTHDPSGAQSVLGPALPDPVPLLYSSDSWYAKIAAARIKQDLAQVGVTIDLQPFSTSPELIAEIQRRQETKRPYVFLHNWYSILPAAEIFLRPLFESEMRETNLTGYRGVDTILKATRVPLSTPDRVKLYRNVQRRIVDEAVVLCLGHLPTRITIHGTRVSGLEDAKKLNVQSFTVDHGHSVDVS